MTVKRVFCISFSPTGTTGRVAAAVADAAAARLDVPMESISFTVPEERAQKHEFGPEDLVVVGCPTYAGRMPNKVMPDFRAKLRGGGAAAVAVVTWGNRGFENAPAELYSVLSEGGFSVIGAGAFVCRHAFGEALAGERPDPADICAAAALGEAAAEKLLRNERSAVTVPGDACAPYYLPRGVDGEPVDFLRAKPVTDVTRCMVCGLCVRVCPMGAIDPGQVSEVRGVCIKCQACVRRCPVGAKGFKDEAFLSHVRMLADNFARRKDSILFLS